MGSFFILLFQSHCVGDLWDAIVKKNYKELRKKHNIKDDAFHHAWKGNLTIAQWLYGIGGINIHAKDELAFLEACSKGHLSFVQWLYSLGNMNRFELGVIMAWPNGCIV
jgi:hypothetical protein